MELIIGLAVLVGLVWFFFFREKTPVKKDEPEAPYKVETPAVEVQPSLVESTPAPVPEVEKVQSAPVINAAEKPKSKKTAAKAKTEKPVKATAAKAKTPAKTKKPKMTVAK